MPDVDLLLVGAGVVFTSGLFCGAIAALAYMAWLDAREARQEQYRRVRGHDSVDVASHHRRCFHIAGEQGDGVVLEFPTGQDAA